MRVAITLEQCWHRVPGGTATAALGTIAALQQLPNPPEIAGVAAWHRQRASEPFVPSVEVAQVRLPRLALYWAWHGLRWPSVELAVGPVDVVHATGMAIPPKTAPMVATVNDLAFMQYPEHFTARGRRFFGRAWQLICADADVIVCPSQHTATACSAAGVSRERLRVVPYGVDTAKVPLSGARLAVQEVKRRYRLGERFVLWVGTVEPRKNLEGLLEAWRMLQPREEQLVLVGPQGWNSELGDTVAAFGNSVRVLGFVAEADKRALLAAATVFCYPSLTEGFGLPVLEAMAQATPVVTSAVGATAEVAGDAGVLVDPFCPKTIADALAGLLDSGEEATRLGQMGQQRAQAEFSWQRSAQGLLDVYHEVAG
ncbi:MAG: glycosyltransferase family 1 protein [bacterium]|nr:glycosyltransferase family 1 protein [bacterium]